MFQAVIRRAEAAVDNILDQAFARALVAVPLLVAAGFTTAAASAYLNDVYGPAQGNLIVAAAFALIALVAAIYVSFSTPSSAVPEAPVTSEAEASTSAANGEAPALGEVERELLFTTLASAAPIAVPKLLQSILRNLPLVLVFLVVAFILSRDTPAEPDPAAVTPDGA